MTNRDKFTEPKLVYTNRIDFFTQKENETKKRLRLVPWIRFVLFVGMIFLIVWYTQDAALWSLVGAGVILILFLVAGIVDQRWKDTAKKWQRLQEINQQEINALDGDYSHFATGSSYLHSDHPFAIDLDLFGKGSLFQFLNRTSTIFGERILAQWLNDPLTLSKKVIPRQKAVQEVAWQLDFRQQFRENFLGNPVSDQEVEELQTWLSSKPYFQYRLLWHLLAFCLPMLTILSIIFAVYDYWPYQIPVLLVLVQFFFAFSISRTTIKEHMFVTRQVDALEKYGNALALIEQTSFNGELLNNLKKQLQDIDNQSPARIILRLTRLLNWMDTNLNMVASVFLNGLLMFNIHVLLALEGWKKKYRELIPTWFDGLASFDAYNSLGNFYFNHPDFVFPDVVSGTFRFDGRDLGHPLIPLNECITNDLQINGWHQLLIITGANMSGKSTFLRTIGVNMILGMVGAPVYASSLTFTPVQLYSCIRTNDSLMKRESYFYAELKRLKQIMDFLETGQPTFLLLDEILRGTNSQDKQAGSMALIRQLLAYKVSGMIATHDLALGNLKNDEPDHIHNHCFEIEISDNKMKIDYKLRPGVCQNLNASFLMKEMGIIDRKKLN
jgi:hypothetical protein